MSVPASMAEFVEMVRVINNALRRELILFQENEPGRVIAELRCGL